MRALPAVLLFLIACSPPPVTIDAGVGGGTGATGGGTAQGGGSAQGGGTGGGTTTDLDAGTDAGTGTGDAGTLCTSASDCASGTCLAWFRDAGSVCGKPCFSQAQCADVTGTVCVPDSTGAGWCVPKSPAHCLPCDFDVNCGSLSEACVLAPGDTTMTCRIDCSLAGADACPAGYTCTETRFNNQMRSFCTPPMGQCSTAPGGFCDRFSTPQPCTNTNDAGTCVGERTCMNGTFTACSAPTAACRTCDAPVRPACIEPLCDGATTTTAHCGACGNACPGAGSATANVTCGADGGCTFSCKGQNYDVNGMQGDGCELADSPTTNHALATPTSLGNVPCGDSNTINPSGLMPSDTRVHENPVITGFVAAQGAAPDYLAVNATGGVCVNDIALTMTVTQTPAPACIKLTVTTNSNTLECSATGGSCSVSRGSNSYDDDTTILLKVERTCSASGDGARYTIAGHF